MQVSKNHPRQQILWTFQWILYSHKDLGRFDRFMVSGADFDNVDG